jgi:hypothetical protein
MADVIVSKDRGVWYGVVIALFVFGVVLLIVNTKNGPPSDQNVSTTTLTLIEHNKQVLKSNAGDLSLMEATKNWQEYRDREAGFSIKYPTDLVAMRYGEHYPFGVDEVKNEEGLFLERPIPFETYDACDLKGDPDTKPLTAIPDFELGIRVFRLTLRETMLTETFYEENDVDALLSGSTQVFGGLIAIGNDIGIGPLKAIYEFRGFEDCGDPVSYVPIGDEVTLIVTEPFYLDSLSPSLYSEEQYEDAQSRDPRVKAYAKIQSQYPTIDREKLTYQILSTFRLLDK